MTCLFESKGRFRYRIDDFDLEMSLKPLVVSVQRVSVPRKATIIKPTISS